MLQVPKIEPQTVLMQIQWKMGTTNNSTFYMERGIKKIAVFPQNVVHILQIKNPVKDDWIQLPLINYGLFREVISEILKCPWKWPLQ